jgi:ubiquinone/menaquinone biosynthesis C-methylase UbiE
MGHDKSQTTQTAGLTLHSAFFYDLTVAAMTFGRERRMRERSLRVARLAPGEAMLDVGCGTGSLAIAAKRLVGSAGSVHGVDASPEMLARAEKKAMRAHAEVCFEKAFVQSLPFADARFDVVTSTVMLHHLPREARKLCAREMRRVVKPGGRVLAVDFGGAHSHFFAKLHRHCHMERADIETLLADAGLRIAESGPVGASDLQYVLGVREAG